LLLFQSFFKLLGGHNIAKPNIQLCFISINAMNNTLKVIFYYSVTYIIKQHKENLEICLQMNGQAYGILLIL